MPIYDTGAMDPLSRHTRTDVDHRRAYNRSDARQDVADLVAGTRRNDVGATEELARRALTAALRTAVAMLGGRQEAADIAQEVAIDALRSLDNLRDPGSFDAWLHRIAVRKTIRAAKAARARSSWEEPLVGAGPASPDWSEVIDANAAVMSALMILQPRQRAALVLRYVHGMTQREIAEALGCRPGTAGALISRGLRRLREAGAIDAPPLVIEKEGLRGN